MELVSGLRKLKAIRLIFLMIPKVITQIYLMRKGIIVLAMHPFLH